MELFILCVKIFFVRILDVSLGTVRTLNTVKGKTVIASLIGFIEILIWFLVVKEALSTNETSIWIAVAYSLGFSTGTYIGGKLSQRFISGNLTVQVITTKSNIITEVLREKGYAITTIDVKGKDKINRHMLFMEINKKNFDNLQQIIKTLDSSAFIVANETSFVHNGFITAKIK